MSALSDYAENKVLDVLGANATFTAPSAVYLGLCLFPLGEILGDSSNCALVNGLIKFSLKYFIAI